MHKKKSILLTVNPFQFAYNLGSGEGTLVYNSTRVDDGLWHRIRATRLDKTASLMVRTCT